MKTDNSESLLVAIEEDTLETVSGGFGFVFPKFDLDIDIQRNEALIAGNIITSTAGDAVIAVTQSND